MSDETDPLEDARTARERLGEAIEEYVQACAKADGIPCLMTGSVVMWEQARFKGDDTTYSIEYVFPSPISMSSGVGIASIGLSVLENDILSEDGED
jgi:hypothetical protein